MKPLKLSVIIKSFQIHPVNQFLGKCGIISRSVNQRFFMCRCHDVPTIHYHYFQCCI